MSHTEEYRSWLEHTRRAKEAAGTELDKTIMTLAGGALAYSITVREKLTLSATSDELRFLKGAWFLLTFSLVAVAVAKFATWHALERAEEQGLDWHPDAGEPFGSSWSKVVAPANYAMLLFFVLGACLLAVFAILTTD